MQIGKTYRKGNREREVVGIDTYYVYYKTKSGIKRNKTSSTTIDEFHKWMLDATLVQEQGKVTVVKERKGIPTVIEYGGYKYSLQHPTHFDNVKKFKAK